MKKFFKSIYQFFSTVYIFESHPKFKKVNKKKILTFFIKSSNEIKTNKNESILFKTCECGHKEIIDILIAYKPKLPNFFSNKSP